MGADGVMDGEPPTAIEGIATAPIDGVEFVPSLSGRSPDENTESACASEPEAGVRSHALETPESVVLPCHHEEKPVNELDAAYEAIPEAERQTWYERADQALEAAGMPEWMRITPTVKEMALRLWVGTTIPGVATG